MSARAWLLLSLCVADISMAFAAPTVGAPRSVPATITLGQTVELTVTSQITRLATDPPVTAGGVYLQRLNASGAFVKNFGVMRDGGANGDATAGDGIYSLRFSVQETTPGELKMQVSAAFKGVVRRILSNVTAVPVQSPTAAPPTLNLSPLAYQARQGQKLSIAMSATDPNGDRVVLSAGPALANGSFTANPGPGSGKL